MPTPRGADRLLSLGALGLGLLFLVRALALVASPYPIEYGEGTTWAYAHLLETRGTYFLPIGQEPYIHGTYPPLFPVLHSLLGGSLRAGRLIGLGGSLLAAAALAVILNAHRVGWRSAIRWSVIFLGTPAVHEWGAVCRVDTLALGLSLLGIAVATRIQDRRADFLAAFILGAAFFAKQIALAAPVSVFLSLRLRGERQRAWLFAAAYAGFVGLTILFLDWRTGDELRMHLVTYAGFVGLRAGPLIDWGLRFVFMFPVFLPLAVTAALRARERSPSAVYGWLALATLVMAGKPGASANYLLEPSAGVVLLAALAAERRLQPLAHEPERRRDFTLLVLVQIAILCGPGRPLEFRSLMSEHEIEKRAVAVLAGAPGRVLSEDLGLTLAAGKEPTFEPFQFGLLAKAGIFDPAPVLLDLRRGAYGAVLAGWRLKGVPGLTDALTERYHLAEELGMYQVWRPLAAPPE